MDGRFIRTQMLLGEEALKKLKESRVAVFGIGGVGGYCVEALARSGVGAIDLIDNDVICLSNLNRQIIATNKTLGQYKVDVATERIAGINPECAVKAHKLFFTPETAAMLDFSGYDYVIDAIDTVTGKLQIIETAKRLNIPVISCMGTGNKLDPTAFTVADISETSVCPLARVMRRELKKRGIDNLKVVFSKEQPQTHEKTLQVNGKTAPASCAFVPPVAGLIAAAEVIKALCLKKC